ncbi:hypothetical protein AB0937_14030 [Streptomyces sp. NPDC047880]|uniref:hypothetical protein n=1 Tax=Streptomyces sp. NPDC047880 TaxID=3155626 RepID=UPI003455F3F0
MTQRQVTRLDLVALGGPCQGQGEGEHLAGVASGRYPGSSIARRTFARISGLAP